MKKELLIDTTFDPPWFSSDYTFKLRLGTSIPCHWAVQFYICTDVGNRLKHGWYRTLVVAFFHNNSSDWLPSLKNTAWWPRRKLLIFPVWTSILLGGRGDTGEIDPTAGGRHIIGSILPGGRKGIPGSSGSLKCLHENMLTSFRARFQTCFLACLLTCMHA